MSDQITTAFVDAYRDAITIDSQQRESMLLGTVMSETAKGDRHFFDRIGPTSVLQKTSRRAPTPQTDTPHSRRAVDLVTYHNADSVDHDDLLRTGTDPAGPYATNMRMAFAQKIDQIIIDAADAAALTGHAGGTSTPLPAGQQVAADFGATASIGLTLAKVIEIDRLFTANHVAGRKHIVISAQQKADALAIQQLTSTDYRSQAVLENGVLGTFMGFTWHVMGESNGATLSINTSTDVRTIVAYSENSIGLALGEMPFVRISERADLSYTEQIYVEMTMAATRLEEVGVVTCLCDESP